MNYIKLRICSDTTNLALGDRAHARRSKSCGLRSVDCRVNTQLTMRFGPLGSIDSRCAVVFLPVNWVM